VRPRSAIRVRTCSSETVEVRPLAVSKSRTGSMTAAAPVSSEDIRLAQTALGRLGYYSGPADGSTTPQLRAAIEAYQKDQKAPATGILDDATLKRLAMLGR
jgi:localization factor PodJL